MYYRKAIDEIFKEFQTNECGLSQEEADGRLEKYGENALKEEKGIPLWKVILNQFTDPLIYVLMAAAVVTFAVGEYIDTGVILVVVLLNAIIGFIQEFKAEKAMDAIRQLAAPKAIALRECEEDRIESRYLVPGDIVNLSSGNKVPADVRLFEVMELEIDESMFTGESVAITKHTEVLENEYVPVADQKNMAFMGTIITNGRGKGIVINTGETTELGKISGQVKTTRKEASPLQKRLIDFSKKVGFISVGLAFLVFVLGIWLGHPVVEMILFAISMSVAVIPEGLPVVITITMAIGLKRMAARNAIIRKLIAVETLGSCNYICSDKTGTITENMMRVTKAYAGGKEFDIEGTGYEPKGDILYQGKKVAEDENLKELLLAGLLCNNSDLYEENGEWKIEGDSTEGALIVAAYKNGLNIEKKEYQYEFIDEIPFSSNRQYMATLQKKNDKCIIFVKGAPEKILDFSENSENKELLAQYSQMAESGLRVLGFGVKEITGPCPDEIDLEYEANHNLKFVGFQGIIDPPRVSAIEAVKATKEAGIRTVMITGDHKITAAAIAKQIGIFKEEDLAITGKEIDEKGEAFLKENVEKTSVYARVSPNHKLKIVEALQKRGNIIAVTGDGINDAPALKKSNIGIAMGKIGTDVAREASDMILKDDNFATIFEAVREGRIIYENIQKVIFFLLGTGFGFAFAILLSLLFNLPLPFLATQVLWINLVTNGLQDVALAFEPGEKGVEKRPPRDPRERIINKFILKRLILVGAVITAGTLLIYWHYLNMNVTLTYARTAAFNTVVFFQFFHVLNARSFDRSILEMNQLSNPFLLISLALAFGAQIAVINLETLQFLFSTTAINFTTWLYTILAGSTIIVAIEIDKKIRRKGKT